MRKRLMLLVLAFCFAGVLTGCGMVGTPPELVRRSNQITDWNARQFVDDWHTVWLYDTNIRLTPWHAHAGY